MQEIRCCASPSTRMVVHLDHMIGDFEDRKLEDLGLYQCRACEDYQFVAVGTDGQVHQLAVPAERGARMVEAERKFWRNLRRWTRS